MTKVDNSAESTRGPQIPFEYPHLCERSVRYFGRERRVRPYTRVYPFSPERTHKVTHEIQPVEEYDVLELRDVWSTQPVCGAIRY